MHARRLPSGALRSGATRDPRPVSATPGIDTALPGGLRIVDPLQDPQWDAKLATAFPEVSPFLRTAWARVLSSTYGYAPRYLAGESNGEPGLILPLLEVRSWLTGARGVSLPFTDYCPALGVTPNRLPELYEALFAFARSRQWRYFELRGTPPRRPDDIPSVSFHGHALDLSAPATSLFARFDSAVRRAVRKAETEGVSVEFEHSLSAVRTFYALLRKTRTRHGLPPQPWRFFAEIHRHIIASGGGSVVVARHRQVPVAASVFIFSGRNLLYKFSASDEAYQQVRGNNLVIWRAIEHYAAEGFQRLDFGRTSLGNEGLRRFKLSWHTEEFPVHYYRYDSRTAALISTPDKAAEGLHTRVFRALPQPLTRLIGAAVYKHLG